MLNVRKENQLQAEQYEKLLQHLGGTRSIHYLLAKIGFIKSLHGQSEAGYMLTDSDVETAYLLNEHFNDMENLKES